MTLRQRVILSIYEDIEGDPIFQTDQLRVDFDIRNIPKFHRATFTLYNANNATVRAIMNGDRYVSLDVQLGGGVIHNLAYKFSLSNAVDELKLPERVLTLFCFDALKLKLDKSVSLTAKNSSLEELISRVCGAVEIDTDPELKSFPELLLTEKPINPNIQRTLDGSAQECLVKLGNEYMFSPYTNNNKMTFMYHPTSKNVAKTDLTTRAPDVTLQTEAMKSNPKIGLGTATIHSNLDPNIEASSLMDLSELLTIGLDQGNDTLELIKGFSEIVAGYSRYQAFAVQHSGSNYTPKWDTMVTAYSPTKGLKMPVAGSRWAQID